MKISRALAGIIPRKGTLLLFAFLLSGPFLLNSSTKPGTGRHKVPSGENSIPGTCSRVLKTGDLLVRSGRDATSMLFREFNQRNKTYSHCGIVLVENGVPYVYHSIGGEDNPDQRLKKETVPAFIAPEHNSGFGVVRYKMTAAQLGRLECLVRKYYRLRPAFDLSFDLSTDDKLYCAEFVYKVLTGTYNDTGIVGKYYLKGKPYLAIDNLFLNPHASFIWEVRY